MINQIVNLPDVDKTDFSSLQTVHYGGSPIPPVTLSKAIALMDCNFIQTYGMTETSTITFLRPADHDPETHAGRLSSAGTAALGIEMRVVDDSDRDVSRGEVGEIICRGAQVIDAYLNKPEATAEALKNHWMHTGDMGYQDGDGFLYVTDRKKDMIVSGGENVYPREVENVLHEHPDVLEAAVIGVPDEKWGERVHAVLVAKSGATLDADEVLAYARTKLAGYKVPKSSQIEPELPKNANGKVVKTVLREPWWKGLENNVS
jgi:acyl-CoA synthetase (AMP-forming)/AMP-acid ligase II